MGNKFSILMPFITQITSIVPIGIRRITARITVWRRGSAVATTTRRCYAMSSWGSSPTRAITPDKMTQTQMKTWEDEYINKRLVATKWHVSEILIIMHLEIVQWKWGFQILWMLSIWLATTPIFRFEIFSSHSE